MERRKKTKSPPRWTTEEFCWVQILLVLGWFLDSTGSTEAQIKCRLFKGRNMFNKHRPMLPCPQILEKEPISAFYSTVGTSVLWVSGCWTPSVNAQQLISVQENRWLRCVLGKEKRSRVGGWLRETKRALRCKLGIPAWWHKAVGLGRTHGPQNRPSPRCGGGAVA